jgi:GNAT superfamily N-acetyltransferase
MSHPLDNPFFNALKTSHAPWATTSGVAARFSPDVAPFCGIPDASPASITDLEEIVAPDEKIVMLQYFPQPSQTWVTIKSFEVLQMTCPIPPINCPTDPEISLLSQGNVSDMMALTALVYPSYFREGTARLGDYFGIYRDGCLCAMAGIRMVLPGFKEISAICTHLDYRGQGLAKRLTTHLIHHIFEAGDIPFLHTETDNFMAQNLYKSVGFQTRATLPVRVLERR